MKSILFSALLLSLNASAVTWEILHPCTGQVHLRGRSFIQSPYPTVGHLTVAELKRGRIEFIGSEGNIVSILKTPIGENAIDKVDSRNMFAYGWCYMVNGIEPGVMAAQYRIQSPFDHIRWFYAFTEMKNGQWLRMCRPANERPLKSYCQRP